MKGAYYLSLKMGPDLIVAVDMNRNSGTFEERWLGNVRVNLL